MGQVLASTASPASLDGLLGREGVVNGDVSGVDVMVGDDNATGRTTATMRMASAEGGYPKVAVPVILRPGRGQRLDVRSLPVRSATSPSVEIRLVDGYGGDREHVVALHTVMAAVVTMTWDSLTVDGFTTLDDEIVPVSWRLTSK